MQTYFAFEKGLWKERRGAECRLNRFERFHDVPALPRGPEGSPDEHRASFPNVLEENGRLRMWYTGLRKPHPDPWHQEDRHNLCLAESEDGIHWRKPALDLEKIETGRAPNNVLPLTHDFYSAGVIRDGAGYVLSLVHPRGLDKEEGQTTFSIYTSGDGLQWTGRRRPCIGVQHIEPQVSLVRFKGWYWVYGQGVSPFFHLPDGRAHGRVMYGCRSRDLKTWEILPRPVYAYPVPRYFPSAGLQVHGGISATPRGRILLGLMGQFWPAGFSEVVRSTFGLVYSYDGIRWHEPFPGEPLLLPDEQGWDCGMLIQGNGLLSRGAHTYTWYQGADGGNLWWPRASIGVCRLRRDRFACLTPSGKRPARLRTRPIRFGPDDTLLYLNTWTSPAHPMTLRLLDASTGRRLAAAEIRRAGTGIPLALPQNGAPGRRAARIEFVLHGKARLYAFSAGPEAGSRINESEWQ